MCASVAAEAVQHLRQLADAGIVQTRREGYYVLYSLVPDGIDALSDAVRLFRQGRIDAAKSGWLKLFPAGVASTNTGTALRPENDVEM